MTKKSGGFGIYLINHLSFEDGYLLLHPLDMTQSILKFIQLQEAQECINRGYYL